MRARFGVIEAVLNTSTKEAVQEAHEHVMDILRLNHSDNMGLRYLAPALFLRLGKDQDAYRFIKWWHLNGGEAHSKLEDGSQPYVDIADANAFESITNVADDRFPDLNHIIALTLLKLRMLADLKSVENSRAVGGKVPQELLESIQDNLISPLVASNDAVVKGIKAGKSLRPHIDTIESQANELFDRVDNANSHFWPALIEPGDHLSARPYHHSSGTLEEMQLALKYNSRGWLETPGAHRFHQSQSAALME